MKYKLTDDGGEYRYNIKDKGEMISKLLMEMGRNVLLQDSSVPDQIFAEIVLGLGEIGDKLDEIRTSCALKRLQDDGSVKTTLNEDGEICYYLADKDD